MRGEMNSVWNFISVENLSPVFSQPLSCVHMNWGKMKLKPLWIYFGHFNRNEISSRHEIFMLTKFTRSEMNKCRHFEYSIYWAYVCEIHCGYGFHNSHFDRNIGHFDRYIISGDEISRKHYPKWNVCACPWTNKQVCHEQRKNICFITNSICILMIFISMIFQFLDLYN